MEIRCRNDAFDLHALFSIHHNLMPYGLHFYGIRGGFTIARIASFTLIESALRYCLGDRALRPCFGEGEFPDHTYNQFHQDGFHGVGIPLKKIKMHNRWPQPAEYPWHDLLHLVEASIRLPVWKQRAASAFFEVLFNLRRTLGSGLVASEDELERLSDLNLDNEQNTLETAIARVLHNIRMAHGEKAAAKVIEQYGRVLKNLKGSKSFRGDPEFVSFKETLPALLAPRY